MSEPIPFDAPAEAAEGADQPADMRTNRAPTFIDHQQDTSKTGVRTAQREQPSSEEAEQHVLATCLLDGDVTGGTIDRALNAGLTVQSFYWPANGMLFGHIVRLKNNGQPVSLETLTMELIGNKADLEAIGGLGYLMQVTSKVPTTAHAGYFIEKVMEKELLRQAIKAGTQTVEEAYNFTGGLDEFLQTAKARTDALAFGATSEESRLKKLQADLESCRVQISTAPLEPSTRLFLAGKPIATPGNLTTVISRAKTGKTTTLSAATAAIVASAGDRQGQDTFKFSAPHCNHEAVIVFDTEQSKYDSWLCYQRGMKRGGQETDLPWFHHYSLVGLTPEQIKQAMVAALAKSKATHKGVFILIIDGVADLVHSVNDEAECNALVTWLRALAVEYDCPIVCVIHSNESIQSGDDGRGHLGKQLIRKAESNLVLKKVGEVTTITSDKQRKAPITEKDGVAFQWSEEKQMHVSCGAPEPDKRGRKPDFDFDDFTAFFPGPDKPHKPVNQIHNLCASTGIKRATFYRMCERARVNGSIERIIDPNLGPCFRLVN